MKNYSATKLELLALKWAVTEKFRGYLLGTKFTVYTDNNPLSYIKTAKISTTEQRWVADLDVFNFDIQYRSGKLNANADALSRNPVEIPQEDDIEGRYVEVYSIKISTNVPPEVSHNQISAFCHSIPSTPIYSFPSVSLHEMQTAQALDPVIGPVLSMMESTSTTTTGLSRPCQTLMRQRKRLVLKDGVLYRSTIEPGCDPVMQVVLPEQYRRQALELGHETNGHQAL